MEKISNVVIVCDYAYVEGGAANVAVRTALAFAQHTSLNVYFFAGCGDVCEELTHSNVRTIALHMPDLLGNKNRIDAFFKGIYNRKSEKEFRVFLSSLNIDETIVHIHTWTKVLSSSIFKVCNETGVRTFLTIHDYFLVCPNGACFNYVTKKTCELCPLSINCLKCNCDSRNYIYKIWRCLRQVVQNKVIRSCKRLNYVFISEFQRCQILRRIPRINNQYIVKNLINVGERYRISAEQNDCYIYIGRVVKEKGVEMFCEAITAANVKGIVVGGGSAENELKARYPHIEFTGWLNKQEINNRLKEARALIFPTYLYEGSPLTVPEVQAFGIPCIVSDCSAAIDDVIHGTNGEIVKCDANEIVESIHRFANNEYVKKMSVNTYNMFDDNRGSEKCYVKKLMEVFCERYAQDD